MVKEKFSLPFKNVKKRDGRVVPFEAEKITEGIFKAICQVGKKDWELAEKLSLKVINLLERKVIPGGIFSTLKIGDLVERILIENKYSKIAKVFILYRDTSKRKQEAKESLSVTDDLGGLSYNSLFILKKRYLKRDEKGNILETPKEMLRRVAKVASQAEKTKSLKKIWERKFFEIMGDFKFLPGTRTLTNCGKRNQQMANCFVFPVGDSIEEIFQSLYESSLVKKNGGGCGFDFSKLRPKADTVAGVPDLAAGPIKIIEMFDITTRIFRQEGRYESGNMAVLNASHPDILKFITAKEKEGTLVSTNISVSATDKFMEAVKKDLEWELVNPYTKKMVNKIRAKAIFELICTMAWQSGDPGMLFLNRINKDNPLKKGLGPIVATNVCGEQPLYPYESCNLGYLNLSKFLKMEGEKRKIDWNRLFACTEIAVRMLDDITDVSWFPVEKIKEAVLNNRRIGLGLIGWAEVLAKMEIPYDCKEAYRLAKKLMKAIREVSLETSFKLGKEKGPFPNVEFSIWQKEKLKPRNVALNTLPPSSNHAIICDTSFGIEPFFALVYKRNALNGIQLFQTNKLFVEKLIETGVYSQDLLNEIASNHGSVQRIKKVPKSIKRIFKVAHDINYKDHIRMQAAFQKFTDNAVSKTINLSAKASVDDVEKAYLLAWNLGCKGITVYRDKSKQNQVIEFGGKR